ncbi:MAG TPA: thiamine phosphate synthase, partial [Burkholderiaceae bacterium]
GYAAGQGAGPVQAQRGFAFDPQRLPLLSWGEAPSFAAARAAPAPELGLYAIVDSAERVRQVLDAGVRAVQLRIKSAQAPGLREAAHASLAACRAAGAEFFLNDHVALARELGAGLHLGQQDLLELGETGRAALSGMALGISTHSLWELCRARALAPRYLACGPVWPTLTKAMPWVPQGLDNLAWWCRIAQYPVVAVGGILQAEQVQAAARCGADGVCVVRALGNDPAAAVPALRQALDAGRARALSAAPELPHPSLVPSMAARGER